MLVCNVALRPARSGAAAIAADVIETAAATDDPGTGNVVFATLVDDPASVADLVDAYLGEIMVEAASASDTVTVGLTYGAAIVEDGAVATDVFETTDIAPVGDTGLPAFAAIVGSVAAITDTGGIVRQANLAGTMVDLTSDA